LKEDLLIKRFCNTVEQIGSITSYRGGVKPAFHPGHVIKTILYLMENGPAGRKLLSKQLGLGETSVRSLFRRLRLYGLIEIDRVAGAYLTRKGKELGKILSEMINVYKGVRLFSWSNPVIVVVSMKPPDNITVLTIRDKAISVNADAALIAFYENGILEIPGLPTDREEYKETLKILGEVCNKQCRGSCTVIYASLRSKPFEIEGLYLGYEIVNYYCQRIRYC